MQERFQHVYAGLHFPIAGYKGTVQFATQSENSMKKTVYAAMTLVAIVVATNAGAQFSMSALTTFSPNSDGWLAPGEGGYTFLGTANNERGLAYDPINSELLLVSRTGGNSVRRLNGLTGADVGALNVTGITGGTFAVNKVAVAADGKIYVGNLQGAMGAAAPFKVYSWANNAAAPVVAYSGNALTGARLGDSTLGVTGTGAGTRLVSGFAAAPAIAGNNGYAVIDPTLGTSTTVGFVGTPPAAGDFRLGLTVGPGGQVWGLQGSLTLRETSYAGVTGTLLGSASGLVSIAERPMAFATVNGLNVLATVSTGDSFVRVYDASNPLALVLLGSGNTTSGSLTANGNGTGDVAFGAQTDNGDGTTSVKLYAMSSNQGIQAFTATVPEPATGAILGLGISALVALRRSRK
jgi:hypothetical protein